MRLVNRSLWVALFAAALALVAPLAASAHEHRDVADGQYSMVVGFSTEPAYSGFLNGLSLEVSSHDASATPAAEGEEEEGVGVEGLEDTLQAEVIFGTEKMELPLEGRWQSPGAYDAWFVPMAAGDYTFHIWGTINDTPIDETFTAGPETFSTVQDQATIQFPKAAAASSAGPMIGSVADSDGGSSFGIFGGAAAGIVIGAAGLLLLQRRRGASIVATQRAGSGD